MILGITLNELFEGDKITGEEMIIKSGRRILSLMMTLEQKNS